MSGETIYIVSSYEETRRGGPGASSHIPSIGVATTAFDAYRTLSIYETDLRNKNVSFLDVRSASALAKIIDGPVLSVEDLEAAEMALQAIMFHDEVNILVPSLKVRFNENFITYLRPDNSFTKDKRFELFNGMAYRDWLVASEIVTISHSLVVDSSLPASKYKNLPYDSLPTEISLQDQNMVDAFNVALDMHAIPSYVSERKLTQSRRGDAFQKKFYHRLRVSWDKHTGGIPPIVCTFNLPPILAIVLYRLNKRSDLIEKIYELKEELKSSSEELFLMKNIISSSVEAADMERRVARIEASFDAILPESRLSSAQKINRKIFSIQNLVKPIMKLAAGFMMNSGVPYSELENLSSSVYSGILTDSSVVDRTVTASSFKKLIKTDGIQNLIHHHFSEFEIMSIEKSLRAR